MKVAMIVPYPIFPPDEGGRVRAYNLLKQISREHEVVLFTPKSPANATCDLDIRLYETTSPGRRRQILDPGFLRRAMKIARDEQPDVIVSEYPWPGLHGAYLARRLGKPLILDAPNVEGDRFRSTGSRVWRVVSVYEGAVARMAARVLVVSGEDRQRLVRKGVPSSKIQVVPNGVDPEALNPDPVSGATVRRELGIGADTLMILFFGQLSYPPNQEAVRVIEREIAPRLQRSGTDFAFVIAGKNAPRDVFGGGRGNNGAPVRFVGAVPAIGPYINAADVVAVPVTSGGGTRLKVLESLACGTPVVSTPAGAEGIDLAASEGLLRVADGWDAFVDTLGTPGVKRGNVPARFLDMYSWAGIASRIEWPVSHASPKANP